MADAITISNLKIVPYTQKDNIAKLVFGDTWSITIKLPTPHATGDKYEIGIDWENTLMPPNRPLCAGSDKYVLEGDELTFTLQLGTARLRDYVSRIKKPMPLAVQIVRIRDSKAETLMLDSILALPSVIDGAITVCEGDPLAELLDGKMDTPPTEGEAGQVLGINEDGQVVWTTIETEQEQADWTENDDTKKSFIKHKPNLATVATTGSYNDLTDKPSIPSKTSDLTNDSDFQTGTDVETAISTAIADKADKATTLAGYGITDAYTKTEVDNKVSAVYRAKGSKQTYADLPSSGNVVGDVWNIEQADTSHGINAGDNIVWTADSTWDNLGGAVDLSNYIERPTGGSNGDVLTKTSSGEAWQTIPAQQQADWSSTDPTSVQTILNKPDINAMIADALTIHNS